MGTYQRKDYYYKKAKKKGLPSRASFKIEEILLKYRLVKSGDTVIDLGAAPGGWTVILSKAVGKNGKVLAMDLAPLNISIRPNTDFLQADILGEETEKWLRDRLKGTLVACICSDMSPKLSGIQFKDAYDSYQLGVKALEIAKKWLNPGGNLVTKLFPGQEFQLFLKNLKSQFKQVKVFEPESSRKTSREVYVLGLSLKP
jgi:23S rRNA (uridine2552-2'-O)-methyltransferase